MKNGWVVVFPTLAFDVFGQQLGRVGYEGMHGNLLRFESQAGGPLLLGGD